MIKRIDKKTGVITLKDSKPKAKRGFSSVNNPQFLSSWSTPTTDASTEQRNAAERLRNQARDLERNNSYVVRFLNEWISNIVGTGYNFSSLAVNAQGREDKGAREIIENAWKDFQSARICTASGDMPYREFKGLSERACARDGGVLIQILRGFDNPHNFALHLLEIDRLDINYNEASNKDGNRVIMGKEIDQYGRPIAYHLLGNHPGDQYGTRGRQKRTRVPADQIIHRYYRTRAESYHGQSLIAQANVALQHLERFEEAELIAARTGASSVAAIERTEGAEWSGADAEDRTVEPGAVWEGEPGESFKLLSSNHPNQNYTGFRDGILKGVCAGLLQSFPVMSQSFEGVSFSSLRESKLNIKALTQVYREMNIDREEEPIFRAWLSTALRTGVIKNLPASNFENLARGSFTGRGFEWVDPKREVEGLRAELAIGAISLSRAVKERLGVGLDVIIAERKADAEAFAAAGLPVPAEFGSASDDGVARTLQQVYLAVGKVITAEEARQIVNDAGGNLVDALPPGFGELSKPEEPDED